MNERRIKEINDQLKQYLDRILEDLLPGGKVNGQEYECGDITGGKGKSLKFNINKGVWQDFATGQNGDIVGLYAEQKQISQAKAAKELAKQHLNYKEEKQKPVFKNATGQWEYTDADGNTKYWMVRYDIDGKKIFTPRTYVGGEWKKKLPDGPRPLYRLQHLSKDKPVMIVEGEKACESAYKLVGHAYDCVTWTNGSASWRKTDFSPIYNRKVLFWPDADEAGIKCANEIAGHLLSEGCPEFKMINPDDKPKGWDAADAKSEGMDKNSLYKWARERVIVKELPKETLPEIINEQESGWIDEGDELKVEIIQQDNNHVMHSLISQNPADVDLYTSTQISLWNKIGLEVTSRDSPVDNASNVRKVITAFKDFNENIWYDDFHQKILTTIPKGNRRHTGKVREWSDIDSKSLTGFIQGKIGMKRVTVSTVDTAVAIHANYNSRNCVKEWMDSLEWDGNSRIDSFFIIYMGATKQPDNYITSASKNFWISMAARIYHPGCKVDTMCVFEGPQGCFKSTSMEIIGGDWHCESKESVTSKDFYMILLGKLIVEIAEMSSFPNSEILRIKQAISCRTDRFRAPYDKVSQDYPRQCIFVGTTNERKYLHDNTGGRRFWPIDTGEIKIDMIREDRDQLFAEAVHRYKNGEQWHIMPESETKAQQEDRRQEDEWESIIEEYIKHLSMVSVAEIGLKVLKIGPDKLDRKAQMRIASSLRLLGWVKKDEWVEGRTRKIWRPE